MQETRVPSLAQEDPLEGMATHSSILGTSLVIQNKKCKDIVTVSNFLDEPFTNLMAMENVLKFMKLSFGNWF